MGHQIVYCSRCQTRILGTELEQGKAYAFGNRFCCKACVQPLLDTVPPDERASLETALRNPQARRTSTSHIPIVRDQRATSTRIPVVRDLPSSSTRMRINAAGDTGTTRRRVAETPTNSFVWIGAGLGVTAVLAIVLLLRSGSPPAPATTPPTGTTARPAPGPGPAPGGDASVLAAREYGRRNPQDLDGQIQRWQQAVFACENTAAVEEAKRGLADALARRKEAVARELGELDRQTKPLLEREAFGGAIAFLEGARRRFEGAEWSLEIEKRIREIRGALDARIALVREEARQARDQKDAARLKLIADRVAAWGVPDQTASLQNLLTIAPHVPAPPPPPPPETPKPPAAFAVWEKAMGLAARRDYAGSTAALGGVESALRAELADDLEALKRAGQVADEAREIVSRWVKGQKHSVAYLDAAGKSAWIEAPFLRAEGARLLFSSGDDVLSVEWGELAPSTLASLFLGRPKKAEGDDRAALVFCLVEGDVEGASKLQSPKLTLAGKYWDWGRKAVVARTSGREAEARALFAAADEGFEDPPRTVASVGHFKDLLAKFADTAFVARNRASISARASGGRDYSFFPDTIAGYGAFRLMKSSKLESAWTCERDVEAGQIATSYAEFAYSAHPEVEYRGWVYAGACCLETFEFGVQSTGLRGPDPKNPKEIISAEPGSTTYLVPKIPFFMRKSHASHGGPKSASRWEWIPIPLPKVAAAGPRTVRILSGQQGFSVLYAAISASPDFAPRLVEVKEREKALLGRRGLAPPTVGLVGYWKFDEGQGATTADSSGRGHHGALAGAAWTEGRMGGGLRFDGVNSYAEFPSTPALDAIQNADYTLSAWFKPEGIPQGKDSDNFAHYSVIVKAGYHMGITYGGDQNFVMRHYIVDNSGIVGIGAGTPSKSCPSGSFYHVAVTFIRKTGQMQFYLNGAASGTGSGAPNSTTRDHGREPWRVGNAWPGMDQWRWAAKGVVDEVRIYDRALSPIEILAVAGVRSAAPPPPVPVADPRPWTPLPLEKFVNSGYRMENGALAKIVGIDNAARSDTAFGDVEFRIRFEHSVSGYLFFAVRQGGEGSYTAAWGRGTLEKMAGKEHELLLICKGDSVTATLDGQPQEVTRNGQPRSGCLQFNISDAELRIKSIEVRELK